MSRYPIYYVLGLCITGVVGCEQSGGPYIPGWNDGGCRASKVEFSPNALTRICKPPPEIRVYASADPTFELLPLQSVRIYFETYKSSIVEHVGFFVGENGQEGISIRIQDYVNAVRSVNLITDVILTRPLVRLELMSVDPATGAATLKITNRPDIAAEPEPRPLPFE